jgi:hypothetical protein
MFIPLVIAAASAADGRNAIAFAPSLPPHRLHPPPAREPSLEPGTVQEIAGRLAALSALLATRLADAATSALDPDDRTACADAACSARDIHALLAGTGP